jgi:hypothetical protein
MHAAPVGRAPRESGHAVLNAISRHGAHGVTRPTIRMHEAPVGWQFSARRFTRVLPTLLRSIAKNKFCNRQIAWVSDFQIKVVVKNESDFVAESLDC